ncbi:phage holin family protein [Clostridium swellfunianum]|uniref:phage holin family protein n=1 Tax=Clostridium swellfunianum TaxID=1367462 RepID=UPI00202E2D78|nr:phage holin family protein [Clostridium swellfunianum]MCM0648619.1 phage holin family protein [Clostridium swellfunianum]
MDIMQFINEKTLILIPVIFILGTILKGNSKVPDWTIPWILLIASIGLSIGVLGVTIQAIIQGILVVGAAVLGNQLFKQTMEGFKGSIPEVPKEIKPDGQITEFRK